MSYYLRGEVSSERGFERLNGVKGLVKYGRGPGNMEVREVAEPVPEPGEVLVEVEAAGICGSDLHVYEDEIAIPIRVPVVVGHEFSGVVAAVGEGVGSVDRGCASPPCRACASAGNAATAAAGAINLCLRRESMGLLARRLVCFPLRGPGAVHPGAARKRRLPGRGPERTPGLRRARRRRADPGVRRRPGRRGRTGQHRPALPAGGARRGGAGVGFRPQAGPRAAGAGAPPGSGARRRGGR